MKLERHTADTAPDQAKDQLKAIEKKYGFIPNLMAIMGNAPASLQAYLKLNELFSQTSLSPVEQQIVILTASAANQCEYCVAAHSMEAPMHRVPEEVIEAIRDGNPIADDRAESLRRLTEEIVNSRGWPQQETIDQFLSAGFQPEQILEVILGVAMKTLSNYTNHLAETPLDAQFSDKAWTAPAK